MSSTTPISRTLNRSARHLSRLQPPRLVPSTLRIFSASSLSSSAATISSTINRCPAPLAQQRRPAPWDPTPAATHASFSSTTARQCDDDTFDPATIERESDTVDVCIVGGGPAGMAAAIRLKQLANEAGNENFRVLLLEKAGEVGAHILSGAVIEPSAISELIPDWLDAENPNRFEHATPVVSDSMRFMFKNFSVPVPAPPHMHNHGNYIVSLNQFVSWLGERAEEVGVEVYPGFAASEVLYNSDGSVKGVATNDLGLSRNGKPKDSFERGMEFHARITFFAEGCHGSLSKQVMNKFDLRRDSQHQTYGLGIKEVWEVGSAKFKKGSVIHSMGYPLDYETYGGAFMYHFGDNLVAVGLVVSLDYPNAWLSPYQEFQKLKLHPLFRHVLEGGKCISYGARSLIEGGFQSIPKVAFPGGAIVGDSAGFVNVPKVKGTHNAMKSGMLAADAAWKALSEGPVAAERDAEKPAETVFLYDYEESLRNSSIWKELYEVRNIRPSFHSPIGLYGGLLWSGLDTFFLRGKTPFTFKHAKPDHLNTRTANQSNKIDYEKPDGKITFDLLTSVSRTATMHEEDEPVHLQVRDWEKHTEVMWPKYKGLETRFCPAGVYEYVEDDSSEYGVRFQINAQNCIHCKTCDIKAPEQDINWQVPQGGEGPKYYMT